VSTPLWTPSAERVAASAMSGFMGRAGWPDYESLHRWSVSELDAFWSLVWEVTEVTGDRAGPAFAAGESMMDASFFPQSRLNLAENLLAGSGSGPAIIAVDETGRRQERSWDELRAEVAACAAALRDSGVGAGDRVVAVLPNGVEAVVAALASLAIGAVFASTSPDFGARAVVDRFSQIEPSVLVTCDDYRYAGADYDVRAKMDEVVASMPSLRRVVRGAAEWAAFLEPHGGAWPTYQRFAFDHPAYILFSSGTTGAPKCIVHRGGGVLLQHRKEHVLHCDIRPGDRVLYFTTTGWMMWNWLVSVLACGATVVLYDGHPMHPGPDALLDVSQDEQVSLLGVSARYLSALRKSGVQPRRTHSLEALGTICSTGSPLGVDEFAFVYDEMKADVHLASISGGTDLCSCFVLGDPTRPVWAGEIQGPGLGMDVDVVDPAGTSLRDRPGERGELVCRAPFPSMPLGFAGDDSRQRYRAAYFERFGGSWAHGDFASWTEHGGVVISGRSDATLNPGGVRIGTAEIYRVVEHLPEVVEALAFSQDVDGDSRVVLLVRLAPGVQLGDELQASIRRCLRDECSPRHVPAVIAAVEDLPRTRSGKLAELAVADAVAGRAVRNTDALENPEVLDAIRALDLLSASARRSGEPASKA
jgi:acetoacetyl-CoA synthetase